MVFNFCFNCWNIFCKYTYITLCRNCRKVLSVCDDCSNNKYLMCSTSCCYSYIQKIKTLYQLTEEEMKQIDEWMMQRSQIKP
jgi:hypothetical protein